VSRKPAKPRLDPETHAAFQIVALANRISASASRSYLRQFGIGVMEWRVLALVAARPEITAGEISQVSGVDKSPVSRAVRSLGERGLVRAKADADDSRRAPLTLTAAGEALHDRMIFCSLEREDLLLAGLTLSERRSFFALMKRIASNMKLVDAIETGDVDHA
jgi:DNA-binding MarR family transcriptional regulator